MPPRPQAWAPEAGKRQSGANVLSGRVAVVTGGTSGIGRAIVWRLAGRGARVAISHATDTCGSAALVQELTNAGHEAISVAADLRMAEAVRGLGDEVERALGPPSVIIHNAALIRERELAAVDLEEWDDVFAVNVRAAFQLIQRFEPSMRAASFGRIVLLSSVAAFTGGVIAAHYAASKGAIQGLIHYLAPRLAPAGITVNVVAPAFITGTQTIPGEVAPGRDRIPVGRLGTVDEVGDAVAALLENAYITNQTLLVDGGLHPT